MRKIKIDGSWFEFQHGTDVEGKYWNFEFRKFTHEQWKELLRDMAGIGMEYIVLMSSALDGRTFYKSERFESFPLEHPNPMETMFAAADELDLKVFVSNDFFGSWSDPELMFTDENIRSLRTAATEEIAGKFAHHKSFYGWYLPNEASIFPYFSETFLKYVNMNSQLIRSLTPGKKTLVAPFGTFRSKPDDVFCRQLEALDVDVIAYQDEVGVRKANVDWTPYFFEQLRKAHDKVGRSSMWADVEVFSFEESVYTSALFPADFSRVRKQLECVAPFVDRILIYQYPGLMSRPGSKAFTPNRPAEKLYRDYEAYLKNCEK